MLQGRHGQARSSSTSPTGPTLFAGAQYHEQEEKEQGYEDRKEQGYAGEEGHEQEEGASEEKPEPIWKPVGPDERDISPTRAELEQRGAASSQCIQDCSVWHWTSHTWQQYLCCRVLDLLPQAAASLQASPATQSQPCNRNPSRLQGRHG